MFKKKYVLYRRFLIFLHIFLVLLVFSTGSLAGLYYSQPFVHIGMKLPQEGTNIWHMKTQDDGSVLTGGNFLTTFSFYNSSIFHITIEPKKVDILYFPIGERPSCLYLHSSDQHFQPTSESINIARVYETIDLDNDHFFKISDLKVHLKSSRWDFKKPKYYELKWKMGFQVPYDKLNTVKQLYMDCAKFGKILFSIHFKENKLEYLFFKKNIKGTFELIIPMDCSLDDKTHSLFYSQSVKRGVVLFKDLKLTNTKFD